MCVEYFLKPQLSPSASGLMGFILGEQAALNPSLNPSKASPDALNQALGLNSKILLATMKSIESRHGLVSCDAIRNQILLTLGNSERAARKHKSWLESYRLHSCRSMISSCSIP